MKPRLSSTRLLDVLTMKVRRLTLQPYHLALLSGLVVASSVVLGRAAGLLQSWELQAYDWMMRSRPTEPADERIVVVGVDESDFQAWGTATISDQVIADLLTRIQAQSPRVIGLDLYRNLPVEPGHDALSTVFRTSPNLIGIEKVIGSHNLSAIPGNPILVEADRVAASDILVDRDGHVRRGPLFPTAVGPRVIESLGLRVALDYLSHQDITPDPQAQELTIGEVTFSPFLRNDGGYVRADDGGYQILLNLRRNSQSFIQVSATDILQDRVEPGLMTDRIVFIGSMSAADSDIFLTSYSHPTASSNQTIYGVELHAQLTSQIISAVLDGRPLIRTLPQWLGVTVIFTAAGLVVGIYQSHSDRRRLILTAILTVSTIGGSYGLLLLGWWVPVVPMTLTIGLTAAMLMVNQSRQLKAISTQDGLTHLANRRAFDQYLEREWHRGLRSQKSIALILCDVDYFKAYNDTYGHPQGDRCLKQVARTLSAIAAKSANLVARYGGEEFVILLPNTTADAALQVAETVRLSIKDMQIEHRNSAISHVVTLSLGVASMRPTPAADPQMLVDLADAGLYTAKQQGRDRAVFNCVKSHH